VVSWSHYVWVFGWLHSLLCRRSSDDVPKNFALAPVLGNASWNQGSIVTGVYWLFVLSLGRTRISYWIEQEWFGRRKWIQTSCSASVVPRIWLGRFSRQRRPSPAKWVSRISWIVGVLEVSFTFVVFVQFYEIGYTITLTLSTDTITQ